MITCHACKCSESNEAVLIDFGLCLYIDFGLCLFEHKNVYAQSSNS
jgi:hypothetical protein